MHRSKAPFNRSDSQDHPDYENEYTRVTRHRHSRNSSEHNMPPSSAPLPRGDYRNDFDGCSEDDSTRVPRHRHSRHPSEHSIHPRSAPLSRGDYHDDLHRCSEDVSTRVARREHGWQSSGRSTHRSRAPSHLDDSGDNFDGYSEDDSTRVRQRKQCWQSSDLSPHRSRARFHRGESRDRVGGYSEDCFGGTPHKASQPARRQRADEAQPLGATLGPEDLSCGQARRRHSHEHHSSRGSYCQEATRAGGHEQLQVQDTSRVTGVAKRVAKDLTPTSDCDLETALPTLPSKEAPLTHRARRKRRKHALSPAAGEHVDKNDTRLDEALENLDAALKHAEDVCANQGDHAKRDGDQSIERPSRRRRIAQSDAANLSEESKAHCVPRSPPPSMLTDEPLASRLLYQDVALAVAMKPINVSKPLDLEALQQEKEKLLSAVFERKQPLNERARPGFSSSVEENKGAISLKLKDASARGSTEKPRKNQVSAMTGAAMARMGLIKQPAAVHHSRVSGFNPFGYPMRPSMPICTLYSKTGRCSFGIDCKWDHPPPVTTASNKEGELALLAIEGNLKYDQKTETLLDEWVKCKRLRDFRQADVIRGQLRAAGVDPDVSRLI